MKRLTETDKWRDGFFLELNPMAKLMLFYLYDNCNEAGFVDYQIKLFSTQLGLKPEEIILAIKELKPLLLSDTKKKLFIKDFLLHQKKLPLVKGSDETNWIISKLESNLPKFNNAKEIKDILDKVVEPKKEEEEAPKKKSRAVNKFVVPERDEFKEYYLSEKPESDEDDINRLYDHYVSCGWKVGGSGGKPMKDWQAAIRNSIRRNEKGYKNTSGEKKKSRTQTTFNVVNNMKNTSKSQEE